ncbi:anti-sigma factor [Nocardioides sp.]|jgi:serine/threonine-protein kinase RsbW|uniref:anti-sigma factor n=1 Tax=Nocardioides sp. TaxID=35761 RepID=UPI00260AD726|nr:anti-sigma factor [Nocardioides sp.]
MTTPDVELRLPADRAFAAVLRTATAGLAARLDFTLEEIEDARIAVGEAAALALEAAAPGADLTISYWLEPGRLTATVATPAVEPRHPDPSSFAWTVLATLADARCDTADGVLSITLVTTSLVNTRSHELP